MLAINKVIAFFDRRQHRTYLLLFLISVSLFTYLQFDPTFADPDSFYHAKAADILSRQGAITEFPWQISVGYYFLLLAVLIFLNSRNES